MIDNNAVVMEINLISPDAHVGAVPELLARGESGLSLKITHVSVYCGLTNQFCGGIPHGRLQSRTHTASVYALSVSAA